MMRLRLLALFALASPPVVVANAQATALPPRRFGLVAGANLATVGGNDAQGESNRTGVMGGALLVIPLGQNLAIQTEGLFTTKGAESNSTGGDATLKLNYIEVPVLLRFSIPTAAGVKPFFYAGPAPAFQTSCKVDAAGSGVTFSATCEELNSQFGGTTTFNSFDIGAMLGGGLAFDVNGRTMTFGMRYNWGLQNVSSDSDLKNRVFSFVMTFEWPFGVRH